MVVVDEAILALSGYAMPDPVTIFYARRGADVNDHQLRADVVLARPEAGRSAASRRRSRTRAAIAARRPWPRRRRRRAAAAPREMRQRAGGGKRGEAAPAIRVRPDFNPLALFAPACTTDAQGARERAGEAPRQPDALPRDGRRRRRASATSAPASRPSPRACRSWCARRRRASSTSATSSSCPSSCRTRPTRPSGRGRRARAQRHAHRGRRPQLTVPPNDRVEVRFPVGTEPRRHRALPDRRRHRRLRRRGRGRAARLDPRDHRGLRHLRRDRRGRRRPAREDARRRLPAVRRPRDHHLLDGAAGAHRRRALPRGLPLRVRRADRVAGDLGRGAARRALGLRGRGLPAPAALEAAVDARLREAARRCRTTTAAWASGAHDPWPYLSIHVAHALVRAKDKGFTVPADMLRRSQSYLARSSPTSRPGTARRRGAARSRTPSTCAARWRRRPRARQAPHARGRRRRRAADRGARLDLPVLSEDKAVGRPRTRPSGATSRTA